ncbi:MAG TPA: extracellular solute-binding protein [Lachnospiraceae bacterium]|nr:extracellular solute-binding protein [Lachnospiraceae bacterium]
MKQKQLVSRLECLLLVLIFLFSGCGNTPEQQDDYAFKNSVYREEEIVLKGLDLDAVSNMIYTGERFYFNGTLYTIGKEAEANSFYAVYDTEGKQISYRELLGTPEESDGKFALGSNGDIYAITTRTVEEEDVEDHYYTVEQYLVHRSNDGTEISRTPIGQEEAEQDYLYANAIFADGAGKVEIVTNSGVLEYDEELNYLRYDNITEEIIDAVLLQDGTLALICYSQDGQVIRKVDLKNNEISEPIVVNREIRDVSYSGKGYHLLISGQAGISGYNIGDSEESEIMNFVNSNADISAIYNLISINNMEFYSRYFGNTDQTTHLSKFTKVDPADVKDTIKLTLGGLLINPEIKSYVVDFNKSNEKYHIQVQDYNLYNTLEDNTLGLASLNADIEAGQVPDILIMDSGMPIDSYMEKGIFEDLNPYLDGKNGIDRSRYLQNIFDAYTINGKLYQLVPYFDVSTVIGKSSLVGGYTGWNMDKFMEVLAETPVETKVFSNVLRVDVLNRFLSVSGGEFLDKEANTCSFNTESFISFLHFLKTLPDLYQDTTDYNDDEWNHMLQQYRNNETLLQMVYMLNFTDCGEWIQGMFGEPITFLGFPSKESSGSAIEAEVSFTISSKSKEKDVAWEFIKYFMEDDYQKTVTMFPVNLPALQTMSQKAMEKPSYTDEYGNRVEYENSYWLGESEIMLEPMSQEEVDSVMEMLGSLHQTVQNNDAVVSIITEEAAPFFAGEKSAEEVAQMIQSRVQLLLGDKD